MGTLAEGTEEEGEGMSNYCTSCGSDIPEGQGRSCSMCYGDINHGSDGYYQRWAEGRERQAEERRQIERQQAREQHEQQ